jgi:hypothetical protein
LKTVAYKPGQSGNPGGRPKERPWKDAINRAIKRQAADGKPWLDKIADRLLQSAADGDLVAIKELGDRLDGKPSQIIEGGDDPIKFEDVTVARQKLAEKLAALVEPSAEAGSDQGPIGS